jgi:hypothetical protein
MFLDTGRCAGDASKTMTHAERNGTPSGNGAASPIISRKKTRPAPSINFTEYLDQHQANARELYLLAGILGVRPDVLTQLRLGYVPESEGEPEHWLFPEMDASGKVIGLLRRYATGKKKRMAGAQCGLIYDPQATIADTLLIVEGPTDVAAALTMGLSVVGRPNNLGGAELLAPMIRQRLEERGGVIVILGENDEREQKDGTSLWPGRDGALHVAGLLSRLTGRRIAWCMPPAGVKDLREWLWQSKNVDVADRERCQEIGKEVLAFVRANIQWLEPPSPPPVPVPVPRQDRTRGDVRSCTIEERGYGGEKKEENGSLKKGSDTTACPILSPAPTDYSQWEKLGPATQEVMACGMTGRPCPRHYVPLLQGKANPRIGLALRVDCRVYACPACGPRRRCRWLLHLMNIFELQTVLYAAQVSEDQVGALSKYVRRHEGDYVVITQSDGRLLLVASCGFPSAKLIAKLDAAESTASALQNLNNSKRLPISTSRDWALRELRVEADYVRRGAAPKGKFALVVNRLKRAKLGPTVQDTDRGARADWLFPGDWADERIEWYYEGLASPPSSGEANNEED